MNENENTPVNSVVDEDWGEISLDDLFTAEAEPEAEETTGEGTEENADPEANQQTGGEDEAEPVEKASGTVKKAEGAPEG